MVFVHPYGDTLFHLISLCDVEGFYLFARRLAGASPQILIHCLGYQKICLTICLRLSNVQFTEY